MNSDMVAIASNTVIGSPDGSLPIAVHARVDQDVNQATQIINLYISLLMS
jgi:hypothetical protein